MSVDIPVPRYNLGLIERVRDKLVERVFKPRLDQFIQGESFSDFVEELRRYLSRDIEYVVLLESVRHLLPEQLTLKASNATAWRLAGNIKQLKGGIAVPPWTSQPAMEYVPLQVVQAVPHRNQREESGFLMTFRVMAGSCCPAKIIRFWSRRFCGAVSRHIGFSRSTGKYPYHTAQQFMNLRLLGLIEPQLCRDGPSFRQIKGAFTEWNRELLRLRFHIEPCPNKWTHPCHNCAVGYLDCPAATHKLTYVERFCEKCGNNAFFDEELSTDRCYRCEIRRRLARKHKPQAKKD